MFDLRLSGELRQLIKPLLRFLLWGVVTAAAAPIATILFFRSIAITSLHAGMFLTSHFRRHGFDEILRVFWVQKRRATGADELQLLIPHLL